MEIMPYLCACVKDGLTPTDTHCLKMCDLQNTVEMHLVSTDLKNSNINVSAHSISTTFRVVFTWNFCLSFFFFVTIYLHMLAVVSPGWKLDPPERYGTLK